MQTDKNRFSLESLAESEDLGVEVLHPGGLEITKELAEHCHIDRDSMVLDVASGTGESAYYLAGNFGCKVTGVDISDYLIKKAKKKGKEKDFDLEFVKGDAHNLSFYDETFDAVISECTICLLDKKRVINEMVRITRSNGYVGIHDISWKKGVPEELKRRLVDLESERPETLDGWMRMFEKAGLIDVITVDRSYMIRGWERDIVRKIRIIAVLKALFRTIKNRGLRGLGIMMESWKIFRSEYTGYGLIVGRKP